MNPQDYARLGALELRRAIAAGRTSVQAVVEAAFAHIHAREPAIQAWRHLDEAGALATARALDRQGAPGLLGGVPLAVKDVLDTADMPTRYGSPIYANHQPAKDAACVALARAAGAVPLGKTVTTEFAYFSPGPTANPRNTRHTPGGSSSGSAAAVADGMVPVAFGTQTAGSLIRPASYCGVFALKPTFGSVDGTGAKRFAPSLDTLGWLARNADDLELMRCMLTGQAHRELGVRPAATLRLGLCRTHEWGQADAGGQAAFALAAERAQAAGITAVPVHMPDTLAGLLQAQKTVMGCEAAIELAAEAERHADQLSPAMRTLLETGRATSRADHEAAQALAHTGRAALPGLLREVDALLVPAAPGEAPEGLAATGDPVFSRVWTLLGWPCVNVPGLVGPGGLPIGMQLVGLPGSDRGLLEAAACLHRVLAPSA